MKRKKAVTAETFICLAVIFLFFGYVATVMGFGAMFSTIMNTAYNLLLETVFYLMAVSVIAGAISSLFTEFGVVALINKLISPAMRFLYGLPGAAALGIVTTFVSDNPAILTLTENKNYVKYFKNYQLPTLCNLGTSFGMGLILATYMLGLGKGAEYVAPVLIGILGAAIGSIVSVKLMMRCTKREYGITRAQYKQDIRGAKTAVVEDVEVEDSVFRRVMNSLLSGGKTGVQMGMEIIPGVLVICTFVMLLSYGAGVGADGASAYTGAAYEGVALLPKLGELISPVAKFLFGFQDPGNIAVPLTSLGSTGAAMALIPNMLKNGAAGPNQIAVFTAIGMCWSGYLSTHVSMMDVIHCRKFIPAAIGSHTIGGLCAGIAANYLYQLAALIL
ncbi:CD0519/CD1768 family membrane protein [Zongyangia hominis]|uniref:Transporter gate domain protein n=1 Tax=Zongyangia hominis TaxID=2763677 RepID=A0A926IBX2_9FIRM|nr:hypothetical protein [Zongyangia hominis]MBC8570723.1 hypothetical protein [Zongyangia hominis]